MLFFLATEILFLSTSMLATMAATRSQSRDAAGPAQFLDLAALNSSSAKVGTFLVRITQPRVITYSYSKKGGGGMVQASRFHCNLAGSKETSYGHGGVRGAVRVRGRRP